MRTYPSDVCRLCAILCVLSAALAPGCRHEEPKPDIKEATAEAPPYHLLLKGPAEAAPDEVITLTVEVVADKVVIPESESMKDHLEVKWPFRDHWLQPSSLDNSSLIVINRRPEKTVHNKGQVFEFTTTLKGIGKPFGLEGRHSKVWKLRIRRHGLYADRKYKSNTISINVK